MPPNVAVVVLDSLRYDFFTDAFDWLPGRRFSQAYSTSHWTIPSHASLFTGHYASEVGVHSKSPSLDCQQPSLPELADENGYDTRCFSANGMISFWDGWDRGFDEFVEPSRLDPQYEHLVDWTAFGRHADTSGIMRVAEAVGYCFRSEYPTIPALRQGFRFFRQSSADGGTEAIINRTRATDFGNREFLLINLMETHTPYHPPDGSTPVSVVTGDGFAETVDDPLKIRAAYAASVEYLADAYRDLHARLDHGFEYVVTLADHGETLGEHGMWNHGYGLYPELTHVPLVVSGPGIEDGVHEDPVSLLDVHRTVANLLGIETESRGQNLLEDPTARDRLTEYHGFMPSNRNQFERKGVRAELYERRDTPLFGLVTSDDKYVYQTHGSDMQGATEDADELRSRLDSLTDSLDRRAVDTTDKEVGEDLLQQLEDLGYA